MELYPDPLLDLYLHSVSKSGTSEIFQFHPVMGTINEIMNSFGYTKKIDH
jgi:hypothetical protein